MEAIELSEWSPTACFLPASESYIQASILQDQPCLESWNACLGLVTELKCVTQVNIPLVSPLELVC